jgi:SPX domain protein involved in polyphosphate accumulation
MPAGKAFSGRCEHKYLVSEVTAVALRGCVAAYLAPDRYMPTGEAKGYHVHSLYLDSPWFDLYRHTNEGIKNRYKLRMRFYDEAPEAHVFLEIKTRTTESIHKLRASVSKASAESLLKGNHLGSPDLINATERSEIALEEFNNRVANISARGSAFVSYRREAYMSLDGEEARVTFDRHITGIPYDPAQGLGLSTEGVAVFPEEVVVELKFAGQLPNWMRELVRDFGLQRTAFPKYVHAVDELQRKSSQAAEKFGSVAC